MNKTKKEQLSKNMLFLSTIVLVITILINLYAISIYRREGEGHSMYPTCENDVAIIVIPDLLGMKYQHSDIVTIDSKIGTRVEDGTRIPIEKRIIGIPGDTVEIKNEILYVNEIAQKEDFLNDNIHAITYAISGTYNGSFPKTEVGDDKYFYLGDNRHISKDSRLLGLTQKQNIWGKNIILTPNN